MSEYNEFAERDAARAQADADEESLTSQYIQALGLLSTLKPDMLINVNDPIWMAKEIEAHVSALRQRAEAAEARADKAEAALTLLDEYAAARLADPYNDKLTFAAWLQSRR